MDEKLLIERSLKGEESAFDELMKHHQRGVFQHCLSIVRDVSIAEDLTQETFVHAFQHLPTFRKEARFSTWIWRIAHNLSLNYLKKNKIHTQEFHDEIAVTQKKTEENPDLQLSLETALQTLPEKQRVVFELYMKKEMRQKEIAERLNLPEGTVRSRIHYAKKNMKKFLEKGLSC